MKVHIGKDLSDFTVADFVNAAFEPTVWFRCFSSAVKTDDVIWDTAVVRNLFHSSHDARDTCGFDEEIRDFATIMNNGEVRITVVDDMTTTLRGAHDLDFDVKASSGRESDGHIAQKRRASLWLRERGHRTACEVVSVRDHRYDVASLSGKFLVECGDTKVMRFIDALVHGYKIMSLPYGAGDHGFLFEVAR